MELHRELLFEDWGLIDYQQSNARQLEYVEKVAESGQPGYLIFCSHPPVVTLGRGTKAGDVFSWQGSTIEVTRGGRATYHGPSQLVIYPIVNLKMQRHSRKPQEIQGFLRDFEQAIVETLQTYDIQAQGRSLQKKLNETHLEEETGVWLGHQKIASLGIAVKKWITYHGAAINVDYDSSAFQGLKPCGFSTETMISLEQAIDRKVDRGEFQSRLKSLLLKRL